MPKNKNAGFRYRVINNCLRNNKRRWTLEDLIAEVSEQLYDSFGITKGISKRQIQEDINIMRSDPPRGFAARIICKNGFYFYEDIEFSIDNNPLTDTDLESIKQSINVLKQFKGLPHFAALQEIISKVEGTVNFYRDIDSIIEFENNAAVKGSEFLDKLYKAIINKKVLSILYKSFKAEKATEQVIHPYYLKEYRNRWFLLGFNQEFGKLSILGLDRIVDIQEFGHEYKENTILNPETYFQDIVGVTVPENINKEIIQIRVSKEQAPYILSKPLHHSQKVIAKLENETIVISVELIPNYEFESLILSYGETIKVISPEILVERLKERLIKASNQYFALS